MKSYLRFVFAACGFSAALLSASAELDRSDRNFFEKAAMSGNKEVAVSQAVLTKMTSHEVKSIAQMMVTDHTAANAELKALADMKSVSLPPADPKPLEKWSEKSKDIDDDYLKEMVSDHKDAVDLFEKALKSKDADVAAFAQKTLPTLRHHLEMVKTGKKNH